ncbi:MAG: acetylxylan esterase [Planctomycetaceae bacterium]|jgi:cephalosporin-C deacetylase-like acetyl esterase|nr:acetylxylan esterase [Planctomycetaceae bacterium]
MQRIIIIFVLFILFFLSNTLAQESEKSFNGEILSAAAKPKEMMKTFLSGEIAKAQTVWQQRYDKLKTVDDITKYQTERKEFFIRQLGKTWDRNSPLNPQITKTFEKGTHGQNAYRVEMLLFESVPKFYVSAAVFLPDPTRFKPPYPAVLVVCGHSNTGKARDLYQKVPALAASNGLLAMSIDPIDQGERSQRLTADGKPVAQSVAAHNIIGAGSILLGRNTATFEYWDMVRAIDYLQSRPDVIPDKIGVTGTSGGGTQTSYIMSLDERVTVAVPSCYLCGLYDSMIPKIGAQDAEQNIFGQLTFGMDHVDYCIMRAPKPTLIETATKDFFPAEDAWKTVRNAKRIFDRFGFSEKMSIIEHDGEHGWHKNLREASIRWMLRWLAGRDEQIFEADDLPIFEPKEFFATLGGEVLKIAGARSTFDLNRDYNDELLAIRKAKNENRDKNEFVATIRQIAGVRPLSELPVVSVENKGKSEVPASLAEVVTEIERLLFKTENGNILLPALKFVPKTKSKGTTIFLHEKSKTADLPRIEILLREGQTVVAVDLRGLGETQAVRSQYYAHQWFGADGTDYYLAYLLGKSYVGMRTEDLLVIARWLSGSNSEQKIELVTSGETVGLVALHAAALEPPLFSGVKLDKPIRSWYDVVNAGCSFYPITNLVHGALLDYDVPELIQITGTQMKQ